MTTVESGLFIDYTPDGQPYLGIEYAGGGISVRQFICNKMTARAFETGVTKAVNELLKTSPRLVAAEGSLDGFRKPQGG